MKFKYIFIFLLGIALGIVISTTTSGAFTHDSARIVAQLIAFGCVIAVVAFIIKLIKSK